MTYNRLQETGADVPQPTAFQLQILKHKADGQTDLAVAQALNVGERTVRRHLDSLIGSLAVSSRAALFVEVGRRGWLDLISKEELARDEATANCRRGEDDITELLAAGSESADPVSLPNEPEA